ncbi:hypothetical protein [Mesonia aestuariivivens]|uniref:Uncharacterized protein n=1 Tax=Mesonia aestuariivivens TaxID=2796128 RepID=A0ABS6W0B8_9FLAO|nr:hypothetical protein [Mesonia aestuariivivens]MBW2961281.1 hypothetical protein [Mesonia aestuariivivens]
MKGKYLITTDGWFLAPDGQEYRAVWGEVEILEDNVLGLKTNRNSTNWYAKVGSQQTHVIVAGCQIHYAVKSEKKPSAEKSKMTNGEGKNYLHPSKIFFAE